MPQSAAWAGGWGGAPVGTAAAAPTAMAPMPMAPMAPMGASVTMLPPSEAAAPAMPPSEAALTPAAGAAEGAPKATTVDVSEELAVQSATTSAPSAGAPEPSAELAAAPVPSEETPAVAAQ